MRSIYKYLLCSTLLVGACFSPQPAHAEFIIKDGWFVNADEVATLSIEEHYSLASAAYNRKDWAEAGKQFRILSGNFPTTTIGQDAFFYLGVAYFEQGEYEFANTAFSSYVKCHPNPQYFEDVMVYKLEIANCFKTGSKRRLFGIKQMPRWITAKSQAIEIYDEVISAVPCHELAAWSLYAKADMLRKDHNFRESIDVYQLLIRRFPKHELAPESYLIISKIYIEQSQFELQNPDLLAFSQINLRRFSEDFPRDERLTIAEQDFLSLKEIYAKSLFETGQFYERIKKPNASALYYCNAIEQFPETSVAQLCQKRLVIMGVNIPKIAGKVEILVPKETSEKTEEASLS